MALTAILSGSTLGFFSSLMGWLFLGLSGSQAFSLYLVLGLFIPIAGIALVAIFSSRTHSTDPQSQPATHAAPQTA